MENNEGGPRGKFMCLHKRRRKLERSHILNSMMYLKGLEKQEQTIPQISILEKIIKIRAENEKKKQHKE